MPGLGRAGGMLRSTSCSTLLQLRCRFPCFDQTHGTLEGQQMILVFSTFCAALVIYSPRFLLNLPDSDDLSKGVLNRTLSVPSHTLLTVHSQCTKTLLTVHCLSNYMFWESCHSCQSCQRSVVLLKNNLVSHKNYEY